MPEVVLGGCTATPLLSYLEGLGAFRAVDTQLAAGTRAHWQGGSLVLTGDFSEEDLVAFFRDDYRPPPILSPWNKDAGFQTEEGLDHVEASTSPRWTRLREAYRQAREIHDRINPPDRGVKERKGHLEKVKDELRVLLASELGDDAAEWIGSCFVALEDGWRSFFLLGSGGADGRLEYGATYLKHLARVIPPGGEPAGQAAGSWLEEALLGRATQGLLKEKVGQFDPSGAGGPNLMTGWGGMESSLVNPWDFVLGLEGALLFRGSAMRRLDTEQAMQAAFPFTFGAVPHLGASGVSAEQVRIETWLPLWPRPASLSEVCALFAEARARVGRRVARNSIDAARAASARGVDRGISAFQRFQFSKRNGKSFLAVPAGLFRVRDGGDEVDLLRQLDSWLDALRSACRDAPASYVRRLQALDRAMLSLCTHGGRRRLHNVLVALGEAQAALGKGPRFRSEKRLHPAGGLGAGWIERADDGSPEFDLALALASLRSVRADLEPVARDKWGRWQWIEGRSDRGLLGGEPDRRLSRLLVERLRDADLALVPFRSGYPASLAALGAFLRRETDDHRMHALVHGLVAVSSWVAERSRKRSPIEEVRRLPRAYAVLKLLFLPEGLSQGPGQEPVHIRPETAVPHLLAAGRVSDALTLAERRLRAHGLLVRGSSARRLVHPDGPRLAAALLFPIASADARRLAELVLVPSEDPVQAGSPAASPTDPES